MASVAAAILASASALPGVSADRVSKAAPGPWVEMLPIPHAVRGREAQIRNGLSMLLVDWQTRHNKGGWETFNRYAYEITDTAGLDRGAKIIVALDPATSSVVLNRVNIIRDGLVMPRLADASFDIASPGSDPSSALSDGRVMAYANIGDLRIGDVVDYGYTKVQRPITASDLLYLNLPVESAEPAARLRHKILWPEDRPLIVANDRTDIVPRIETQGGLTTYVWDLIDPAPALPEQDAPPGYEPYSSISVSSTSDWQDVVDPLLPYFEMDAPLPPTFVTLLDGIAARSPRPEDRIVETLRFIQDKIGYLAVSLDAYLPRKPEVVLESGVGDCKDKAFLLVKALAHLGVPAVVALTHASTGPGLCSGLPSIHRFDHTIVKATIGRRTYWLDPSNYLQGGRAEDLSPPAFGFALPIVAQGAKLEKIERGRPIRPTVEVEESFEFPLATNDPLRLTVVSRYNGVHADTMRARLAAHPLSETTDAYFEVYGRRYPGLRAWAPPQHKDDRDANLLSITEHYELPAAALTADGLINRFPLVADLGLERFPKPGPIGRKAPIWIGGPYFTRHKIVVSNLKARFDGPDPADRRTAGLFGIHLIDWNATDTTFEMEWLFGSFADQIPASEIGSYLETLETMLDNEYWTFDFAQVDGREP